MKNMKLSAAIALSFTLLLANSLILIAQSKEERQKIAIESYEKGRAAAEQGNYREAIEHYTVAIALDPDYLIYDDRGDAKLELKDYRGAIADYDTFIQKCADERSQGLSNKQEATNIHVGFASNSKSRVALVKLCELALPSVYNHRGIAKDRLGDKLGACKDFREACKLASWACKNSERICNDEVSSVTEKNPSTKPANGNSRNGAKVAERTNVLSSLEGTKWTASITIDEEETGDSLEWKRVSDRLCK